MPRLVEMTLSGVAPLCASNQMSLLQSRIGERQAEEDQMHYVILASHSAEVCPTGNAKTKALLQEVAPQIPNMSDKHGVKILAGPFANREHVVVVIAEADRSEAIDGFLVESRLAQWNTVRILPSLPMEAAMQEIEEGTSLF
jgi:uncharacterized protein with GYD domain